MSEKTCYFCKRQFSSSRYHPDQNICSSQECQRKRRTVYHRKKLALDPTYRDQCRDSQRKWREKNPDYMKRYMAARRSRSRSDPQSARLRSELRRLQGLLENNVAFEISSSAAKIWMVPSSGLIGEKNTLAKAEVIVIEGVVHAIGSAEQ